METAIISRGNRPTTNGRHYVRMPIPTEMAGRIQRGFAILDRYPHLLSERGLQLAQQADHFFAFAEQLPPEQIQNRAQALLQQMPSIQAPHLELLKKPDTSPFEEVIRKGGQSFFTETNKGCETHCTFCGVEAPPRLTLMPFPMILQIAETLRQVGGKMEFVDNRSDPFQYRDVSFGADLGDVIKATQDVLSIDKDVLPLQTHGWPRNHKYALPAAEKINGLRMRISRLSVHLFHKEFEEVDVAAETFHAWGERFAAAIELLKPRIIGLRYNSFVGMGTKHQTLEGVTTFYQRHIEPHLSAELRGSYGMWRDQVSKFCGLGGGRGSEHIQLEMGINSMQAPLYSDEQLPPWVTLGRPENGIVMHIYADGAFTLDERTGKYSEPIRQTGRLF